MDRVRELIVLYRRALVVCLHGLLWTTALVFAVLLRFEFEIPTPYVVILPKLLGISLVVRAIVHWRLGLFHGLWRYSGSRDLRLIIVAATVSSLSYAAAWAFMQSHTFPRSIFVLDW